MERMKNRWYPIIYEIGSMGIRSHWQQRLGNTTVCTEGYVVRMTTTRHVQQYSKVITASNCAGRICITRSPQFRRLPVRGVGFCGYLPFNLDGIAVEVWPLLCRSSHFALPGTRQTLHFYCRFSLWHSIRCAWYLKRLPNKILVQCFSWPMRLCIISTIPLLKIHLLESSIRLSWKDNHNHNPTCLKTLKMHAKFLLVLGFVASCIPAPLPKNGQCFKMCFCCPQLICQ